MSSIVAASGTRACVRGAWLVLLLASCRAPAQARPPEPVDVPAPAPGTAPATAPGPAAPSATRPDDDGLAEPDASRGAASSPGERPSQVRPAPAGPVAPYDREQWPHWIDADGDCQDTRTEVLIAESEVAVEFTDARRCHVARGRWRCPYTDRVVTDPAQLDVDHLLPLAYVHAHGGARWDRARRTAYANALEDPDHLQAVLARANRAKGSRSFAQWLPEEPGSRCGYVEAWLRISEVWGLSLDDDERRQAADDLAVCRARGVPERPHDAGHVPAARDTPAPAPAACCRVCTRGQPCGDACIAADRTCHAPPGCACARASQ